MLEHSGLGTFRFACLNFIGDELRPPIPLFICDRMSEKMTPQINKI